MNPKFFIEFLCAIGVVIALFCVAYRGAGRSSGLLQRCSPREPLADGCFTSSQYFTLNVGESSGRCPRRSYRRVVLMLA